MKRRAPPARVTSQPDPVVDVRPLVAVQPPDAGRNQERLEEAVALLRRYHGELLHDMMLHARNMAEAFDLRLGPEEAEAHASLVEALRDVALLDEAIGDVEIFSGARRT